MSGPNVVERCRDGKLMFGCPGCGLAHEVNVDRPERPRWEWNRDMVCPTFKPSILVRGTRRITDEEAERIMAGEKLERVKLVCHSFVTDGQIRFLGDCTHEHAGKTLPLPPIENEDA